MKTQFPALFISIAFAAAGVGSLPAFGQESGRQPDPGDSRAPTIADKPESAFKGYKSFREQPVRSWKDANQEVADNPGMGPMANMPGMNMPGTGSKAAMSAMNMPGMDSKGAAVASGKTKPAVPGMGAMPGMNMPGMDSKGAAAAHGKSGSALPGMGSMPTKGTMPGMNMAGVEAKHGHEGVAKSDDSMPDMASKDGHAPGARSGGSMPGMAMPGMSSKSDESENAPLTGTGVVRGIDKAGARIKLTHDPIAAVSWPQMTIVFRVTNASLVDQVKQGDKVKFVLTKSSAGYVISDIQSVASRATNPTK